VLILALAAVGVGLRLLVMAAIWLNGGSPLLGDEGNYVLSALPLAQGRGIPDLWLWIRAPGYIFFAATVFAVTGGSLWALNLMQALLSVVVALCAGWLGTFSTPDPTLARRAAIWSAALVALNPLLVFYDNFFLSEQLYLLWVLLAVICLCLYGRAVQQDQRRTWPWLVGAGISSAVALLTRPSLLFYLPLVALWLVALHRRRPGLGVARIALLTGVVVLCVLPWSFRNMARFGHFIFLDTTGPINFFLDNTDLPIDKAKSELAAIDNHADRQDYALSQAVQWITTHKQEFVSRTAQRVVAGLPPDPFTDLRYPVRDKLPGTATWDRDLYAFGASIAYVLIVVLAVAGLLVSPRSDAKALVLLFILTYLLTIGLSHSEFRYRLPVLGLMSPFAGFALSNRGTFWPLRDGGRWRIGPIAASVFAVIFVLVGVQAAVPGLVQSVNAQNAEGQAGAEHEPAARAALFEKAAEIDVVSSWPLRQAGIAYEAASHNDKATQAYEDALAREPGDWKSRALLADLYRREGDASRSRKVVNGVPPTFNLRMQNWAFDRAGPAPALVDVGGADIGWVRGFHIGESDQAGGTLVTYRWSTGSASLRVGVAPGATKVVLRARALPDEHGGPLHVDLRIGDRGIGGRAMDAQWRDYEVELTPGEAQAKEVTVTLSAWARPPSEQDTREIAVAVDKVETGP
jgi:4-amino-4-deoxy-L-arabinose transferase-like glycosyltransferase